MPHKNIIRHFTENGIYHIYNRGVEKRNIFEDEQDYAVFLHLLKYYLSPLDPDNIHPLLQFNDFSIKRVYPLNNLEKEINLIEYCLMPNHFHLLAQQVSIDGITQFLRKLATTYAMYFNKRYKRVGYLFQGRYKAILVETDSYLLHLSRYIHLNPSELPGIDPLLYPYSSLKYFTGHARANWIKPKVVLDYFQKNKQTLLPEQYLSYEEFLGKCPLNSNEIISNLSLE